jgi:hypothetical protein
MSVLGDMQQDAPDQIAAISSSIDQIQDQIDELNIEISGVTDELCAVAEQDLIDYLENVKLPSLYYLDASVVSYGPEFGTINYDTGGITDWRILDTTGNIVYSLNINWDSDATITKLIDDYEFGNDYLTRPATSGASYGLIPSRDNLLIAKGILTENRSKVSDSITVFEDYK